MYSKEFGEAKTDRTTTFKHLSIFCNQSCKLFVSAFFSLSFQIRLHAWNNTTKEWLKTVHLAILIYDIYWYTNDTNAFRNDTEKSCFRLNTTWPQISHSETKEFDDVSIAKHSKWRFIFLRCLALSCGRVSRTLSGKAFAYIWITVTRAPLWVDYTKART